jgi:glycosyltransferase involved in cell wall biosynthesis
MINRIWYITNSRFPTEKAHGVQIALNCNALIDAGADLTLFVPNRKNSIQESVQKYYDLDKEIPVKRIWTVEIPYFDILFFLIQSLTFYIRVFFLSLSDRNVKIITRDNSAPYFLVNLKRVIWEIHELPRFNILRKLLISFARRCQKIIAVNRAVEEFLKDSGLKNVNFLPNGADLSRFQQTSLKIKKTKAIYLGSFYKRKGADLLITAAKYLSKISVDLYGGPKDENDRLKILISEEQSPAVMHNSVPYYDVPKILKTATVLVIPNSSKDRLSSSETLPLKMIEYLATNKPIVASRVPSLKYFENFSGIFYFRPDDSKDLARAILEAVGNSTPYKRDLKKFDIKLRAQKIMQFVADKI